MAIAVGVYWYVTAGLERLPPLGAIKYGWGQLCMERLVESFCMPKKCRVRAIAGRAALRSLYSEGLGWSKVGFMAGNSSTSLML